MTADERRAYWGRLHVRGDRSAPVEIFKPTHPFWKPEHELTRGNWSFVDEKGWVQS